MVLVPYWLTLLFCGLILKILFQVAVLEDIIKGMKVSHHDYNQEKRGKGEKKFYFWPLILFILLFWGGLIILYVMNVSYKSYTDKEMLLQESAVMWNDVVFIPPGFDVPTDPSQYK